eukprot:gb/GECH01002997.1/.p1 GENE.gb/GECH01002997.1/~~gb/GECH01002997.1/.p1  ORF type:complete len:113 (+),score=17.77 gb/GECH01002997.1/:1-339(+)
MALRFIVCRLKHFVSENCIIDIKKHLENFIPEHFYQETTICKLHSCAQQVTGWKVFGRTIHPDDETSLKFCTLSCLVTHTKNMRSGEWETYVKEWDKRENDANDTTDVDIIE